MERFGELRSLIAGKPSRKNWRALCELLDAETDTARRDEIVLTYCREHFINPSSPWGKQHRKAPNHWFEPLQSGGPFPVLLSLASHLEIGWCREEHRDQIVHEICTTEHMGLLRALHLDSCSLKDHHAEQLAASPNLRHLTTLSLAHNQIGSAGFAALARSPHLRELESLTLQGNRIGDEGLDALIEADTLPALKWLDMNNNKGITDEGIARVEAAEHLPDTIRKGWRRW